MSRVCSWFRELHGQAVWELFSLWPWKPSRTARTPKNLKWLKKWLWGFPPRWPESDPKSDFFDPQSDHFDPKSGFLGVKKVTFGVTFRSLGGKPRKSLFESLLIFWGSGGSRGFPGSQYFLGKSHFSYMKECFRNSFRNNFWLPCKVSQSPLLVQKAKGFLRHTTPHLMAYFGAYHSPRKHYLPEKFIFELFSDYHFTISISSN